MAAKKTEEPETPKTDNLAIWKRREKTDPRYVKKVNARGGFSAIAAQWQRKQATAEFGPYGIGWGLRNLQFSEYTAIGLAELPKAINLDAEFWYIDPESGKEGFFPISVDMAYKVGDDCRKKLVTDATTKALSFLGFSADVFLGLFDDNKYVEQRTKEEADAAGGGTATALPAVDPKAGNPLQGKTNLVSKSQRLELINHAEKVGGEFGVAAGEVIIEILHNYNWTSTGEIPADKFLEIKNNIKNWEPK